MFIKYEPYSTFLTLNPSYVNVEYSYTTTLLNVLNFEPLICKF